MAYDNTSGKFLGLNNFGMRLRHETFDAWLTAGASADTVIANLHKAHFDPEFFRTYYPEIKTAFEQHKAARTTARELTQN